MYVVQHMQLRTVVAFAMHCSSSFLEYVSKRQQARITPVAVLLLNAPAYPCQSLHHWCFGEQDAGHRSVVRCRYISPLSPSHIPSSHQHLIQEYQKFCLFVRLRARPAFDQRILDEKSFLRSSTPPGPSKAVIMTAGRRADSIANW